MNPILKSVFQRCSSVIFSSGLSGLAVLLMLVCGTEACGQFSSADVILTEFFEEIYGVDTSTGAVTDILDNDTSETIFAGSIAFVDSTTAYITEFDDLHIYNLSTQSSSLFTTLPFSPSEITADLDGNLIATSTSGVFRIDTTTAAASLIHDETFFGVDDAVVADNGNIFVTEFFDALGVVGPNGGFNQIGDFSANEFAHIDIGPDGQLYLASTFGGEFWRVDPVTGAGMLLGEDLFSSLDDIQVDDNGDLLFTASVDLGGGAEDGLYVFDPDTAVITNIFEDDDINGGFFSPADLTFIGREFRSTALAVVVPEPSSATFVTVILAGILVRRRRQYTF